MRDILPPESALWERIEQVARDVFRSYAYDEIRTPLVEPTELFARGVGEDTDIVTKEMYTFEDRGRGGTTMGGAAEAAMGPQSLTLRPEATASVIRAYIEHRLDQRPGLKKYYYMGPMFRRERPQKGRYRQFYQIGAEAIGSESPAVDAEVIEMLVDLLGRLGLSGYALWLNSVGCKECRPRYISILRWELAKVRDNLCADCQRRSETNPLRVLDCKVPEDQPIIDGLPTLAGSLCVACNTHFDQLQAHLKNRGIRFTLRPRLVRGLDYYTRTTFEFKYRWNWRTAAVLSKATSLPEFQIKAIIDANPKLFRHRKGRETGRELYSLHEPMGTQNVLLGGGRYDGLSEELGGPPAPGIGFSIGEDRLLLTPELVIFGLAEMASRLLLYIAWIGEEAYRHSSELARELRARGATVEVAAESAKLKKSLEVASKLGASHVLVIGEDELKHEQENRYYPLKDFTLGETDMVKKEQLFERFQNPKRTPALPDDAARNRENT